MSKIESQLYDLVRTAIEAERSLRILTPALLSELESNSCSRFETLLRTGEYSLGLHDKKCRQLVLQAVRIEWLALRLWQPGDSLEALEPFSWYRVPRTHIDWQRDVLAELLATARQLEVAYDLAKTVKRLKQLQIQFVITGQDLSRIADKFRKRNSRADRRFPAVSDCLDDYCSISEQLALVADVEIALQELTPEQRAYALRHDMSDEPIADIAEDLDHSLRTGYNRRDEARCALEQSLKDYR